MDFTLIPHSQTPCPEVSAISVNLTRDERRFELNWRIEGDIAALVIPEAATPARTDGLWQHLCVELFVKDAGGPGYTEYNFSPSGAWAAYRFDDYRAGMRELEVTNTPEIDAEARTNLLCVRARIVVNDIQIRNPELVEGLILEMPQRPESERQPFDKLRATGGVQSKHKRRDTEFSRIALSAVIETKSGTKSYWALAHPPGKPDFHHADCFIGKLAATDHL